MSYIRGRLALPKAADLPHNSSCNPETDLHPQMQVWTEGPIQFQWEAGHLKGKLCTMFIELDLTCSAPYFFSPFNLPSSVRLEIFKIILNYIILLLYSWKALILYIYTYMYVKGLVGKACRLKILMTFSYIPLSKSTTSVHRKSNHLL